jgi:signal transduction histidine kinase
MVENKYEDSIAALSHDLLTPVAVIRGFAEAIVHKARSLPNDEIEEWAENIIRNAESLVELVRSLREQNGQSDMDAGAREPE